MEREKIVLFDGKNLDKWTSRDGGKPLFQINGDGTMTTAGGDIVSTEKYSDAHIHVEFWLPLMADKHGQARANSGVYVHGCYEVQVLDSFGKEDPQCDDCSGIYTLYKPLINANKNAEEWQTYDIYFKAPTFNPYGEVAESGRMTVIFNGQCVHNNIILPSVTPGGVTGDRRVPEGPLMLQFHGDAVRYRNVWFERL